MSSVEVKTENTLKRPLEDESSSEQPEVKKHFSDSVENSSVDKEEIVEASSKSKNEGFSSIVAEHYNKLEEKGLAERSKSRIFYMRNFNNWIKSMLISEYLNKLKFDRQERCPIKVLDMCCGKGGDLLKWKMGNIRHLICADIAETSIEQCQSRYNEMKRRQGNRLFSAEFITADCTKERLSEKFQDKVELDLVSCQFSFHYSFESYSQAQCMLRNASECLKTGGYFIGTIPNAADIVFRHSQAGSNKFGNDIYEVQMGCEAPYPLFGARYDFYLEGVVNCPEFLVHFPAFVKLASNFGLKLIDRQTFKKFYESFNSKGRDLLERMRALETYPAPNEDVTLIGTYDDYTHAKSYMEKHSNCKKVGTLTKSEWEAISLYQIFIFEKE